MPLPHFEIVTKRLGRLRAAHLYLVCDDQPSEFLACAFAGGVDIVQLRMKDAPDEAIALPTPLIRVHPERIVSWGLGQGRSARTVAT